jgi:SAM-dependent methyltransferase
VAESATPPTASGGAPGLPRTAAALPERIRRLGRRGLGRLLALRAGGPVAKRLVRSGYDAIAAEYAVAGGNDKRDRWVAGLARWLPPGAHVLDLGCGPGREAATLSARGVAVTGVDFSAASVALAGRRAPGAEFVCADMSRLRLPPGRFDAVLAFYSLIHLPRREQAPLIERIRGWLRPGGVFLVNVAARPFGAIVQASWLGAPMFWSSIGAEEAMRVVQAAGFRVLRSEVSTEAFAGVPGRFLWIAAAVPGGPASPDGAAGAGLLERLDEADPPPEAGEGGR